MTPFRSLAYLFAALCFVNVSSAFSVQPASAKQSCTVLQASTIDDKDRPNWIDQPRVRDDGEKFKNVEVGIGRLAMIGFFGLLTNEVMSGESFGQQILDVFSVASGH